MTIGYNDPGWGRRNPVECGANEYAEPELDDAILAELFYDIATADESDAVATRIMRHLISGEYRDMTLRELIDECLSMGTVNQIWGNADKAAKRAGPD